eukprot:71847-Chlamydomonas_euryale.AAC.1
MEGAAREELNRCAAHVRVHGGPVWELHGVQMRGSGEGGVLGGERKWSNPWSEIGVRDDGVRDDGKPPFPCPFVHLASHLAT